MCLKKENALCNGRANGLVVGRNKSIMPPNMMQRYKLRAIWLTLRGFFVQKKALDYANLLYYRPTCLNTILQRRLNTVLAALAGILFLPTAFNFMQLLSDISLKPYHTFATQVYAKHLAVVESLAVLQDPALAQIMAASTPVLVLGGGSNVLFTHNFAGLVLLNRLRGISVVQENSDFVWLRIMGGECWDDLVQYCVTQNWGGIENLSLIPGTVGAAPIQNIGAYGVELADVFHSAEVLHLPSGNHIEFFASDCAFAYRNSFFKQQQQRGEYFIYALTIRLNKKPVLQLSYGDISKTLAQQGIETPTLQDIRRTVCAIRQSKLPDPKKIGNAGSFFKNPEVVEAQYLALKKQYPHMPAYVSALTTADSSSPYYKIPAAWLIEQAYGKGTRIGDAGTHVHHALVLVNYGNATGRQIYEVAQTIIERVKNTFGIHLTPEVNIM